MFYKENRCIFTGTTESQSHGMFQFSIAHKSQNYVISFAPVLIMITIQRLVQFHALPVSMPWNNIAVGWLQKVATFALGFVTDYIYIIQTQKWPLALIVLIFHWDALLSFISLHVFRILSGSQKFRICTYFRKVLTSTKHSFVCSLTATPVMEVRLKLSLIYSFIYYCSLTSAKVINIESPASIQLSKRHYLIFVPVSLYSVPVTHFSNTVLLPHYV